MPHIGNSSITFNNPVYIKEYASIVGTKEGAGPLKSYFSEICSDPLFGGNNWEDAESRLIKNTITSLLHKSGMDKSEINYLLCGDLLGQLIATSFGVVDFNIPLFGLYGACSTFGEALSLGSILIDSRNATNIIASASSHFASAEKTFRFPLGYGNQRKFSATWTVTGCGGVVLSSSTGKVKIAGITTGKIVDFGLKNKENMGACMAPAADTIYKHLIDFNRTPDDYDKIYTWNLGYIGQTILIDLLREKNIDISNIHDDCGIKMFDINTQDTHAGASGCGCSAAVFCSYIMSMFEQGKYKRVFLVPTGALLSPISSNEGNSVPGIAHAVVIEAL